MQVLFNPKCLTKCGASNNEINRGCSTFRKQHHSTSNTGIYRWNVNETMASVVSGLWVDMSGARAVKNECLTCIPDGSTTFSTGSMEVMFQNYLIIRANNLLHCILLCEKLVGDLHICRWLRVATAFIKCRATVVTAGWDDKVNDLLLKSMIAKLIARIHCNDPAHRN